MFRPSRLTLCLLVITAVLPVAGVGDEPKPPILTPEEQKLADESAKHNLEGVRLLERGKPAAALEKLKQALAIDQKLYAAAKYPGGHSDLAGSFSNVGSALEALGREEEAFTYYEQCLEINRRLYPMAKYPLGHEDLCLSLNNMGFVLQGMGQAERAIGFLEQSLAMSERLFPAADHPNGHAYLAGGLNNLGNAYILMGEAEKGVTFLQRSLDMRHRLYPASSFPDGHPELALGLNQLGVGLGAMNQFETALLVLEQALEMRRRLYPANKYPDGHPDLQNSHNNVAMMLQAMGQEAKALPMLRENLEMKRRLYPVVNHPDGHPSLATSLSNLGYVLDSLGQRQEALLCYEESLEMRRRLYPVTRYPDGYPDLAVSLNNLGSALLVLGEFERALAISEQSLEMNRRLYPAGRFPDGHPWLAISLSNAGSAWRAVGQVERSLHYRRECLEMHQRLLRRELHAATESTAMERIAAEPRYLSDYLSVTSALKRPAAECFALVTPSRARVMRLLEQRQANARAARTQAGVKLEELRSYRRRIEQLLQDPGLTPRDRDKLLVEYAGKRDRLERELVHEIPALKRWEELDKLGPADLVQALPTGTVFIDIIRYTRFEQVNQKQQGTPSYVAFAAGCAPVADAPGSPAGIVRVELVDASPIDAAVRRWRAAIEVGRDASEDVAELTRRVWEPIAKALPPGTKTLYLAADGDLARLPWAALSVAKDRVLLEDYAIAQVPHGTFLLDHLRNAPPQRAGPASDSLLTLGGVDYGPGNWPALPGTAVEIKAIAAVAPGRQTTVSGKDATRERLVQGMPAAQYVHLATHGQFKAVELTAEKKRAEKALATRLLGDDTRRIAAKNPLGYVGLVLANGEVLSGLGIFDLPLQNTKLVTLSACETGLGEYTGGEGVQGLQRAFHLAGCPNVVASLWKVNDAATAALMAKFYYEMWVNKKPPIEALREAQLTIYRRPDLIPALAAERGLKLEEALNAKSSPPVEAKGTTPTKLWAAFVLSGLGN